MDYIVVGAVVAAAALVVALPLFRKRPIDLVLRDEQAVERLVAGYRAALTAGTVCDRCLRDNPPGSNYCAECGQRLSSVDSGSSGQNHGRV